MIKKFILASFLLLTHVMINCQNSDEYQVYAIKYLDVGYIPAESMAVGANPKDSVKLCFMVWLLKGENGRNILVDAGYIDTSKTENKNYVRPDLMLQRMNVSSSDITDVILTHPHWDQIGGINLFPKANVWMQKDDFDYFVGEMWQENGNSDGFEKMMFVTSLKSTYKVD
jgi:glyoxylase-like metal-dependent hydrolase (beta-lactamase superfamily II)